MVTLICNSDKRGGAAVATFRLMQALRTQGVDARMLVAHKDSDNLCVAEAAAPWRTKAAFLRECADIFLHDGFSRENMFKISTGASGLPLSRHPWVKDADAIVLNWVNQGLLSLKEIGRIKAPVYWNMHDMWNLTGVCHHAGSCNRFTEHCNNCPLLGKCAGRHDLAAKTWARKQRLYGSKPLQFVAVSNWLAGKCAESALMRGQKVDVILNAFPIENFSLTPEYSRGHYGLPDGKLIVMGAARLDDPIKGLDFAIEALNELDEGTAVFYGTIRNPQLLEKLKRPYVHLGPISSVAAISDIYAHATAVLSASHYETLPTTLIEGMACGCVPVCFGQGGQADIVDHLRTGYIAKYPEASDLTAGLKWALNAGINAQTLRTETAKRFGSRGIAERWIKLMNL